MALILGYILELLCFTCLTSCVSVQPCASWGQISVKAPNVAQDRLLEFNKYWLMVIETVSLFLDMLSLCLQEVTESLCWQFPWQQKLNASKLKATQKSWDSITLNLASFMTLYCLSTKNRLKNLQYIYTVNSKTLWWLCHGFHGIIIRQSQIINSWNAESRGT